MAGSRRCGGTSILPNEFTDQVMQVTDQVMRWDSSIGRMRGVVCTDFASSSTELIPLFGSFLNIRMS